RGERSAAAGVAVARGAVDAVQVAALGRVGVRDERVQIVGDGAAAAEVLDVGTEPFGLLLGEGGFAGGSLGALGGQRHATGVHLELDGRRTDADEARSAALDALAVVAVAADAARVVELLAFDDLGIDGVGAVIGFLGVQTRREHRVEPADYDQRAGEPGQRAEALAPASPAFR